MKFFYTALIGLTIGTAAACSGGKSKENDSVKVPEVPTVNPNGLKIAFYNSDSLMVKFDYFRIQDSILQKKQASFEKEFGARQAQVSRMYEDFVNGQKNFKYDAQQLKNMEAEIQRLSRSLENFQQTQGGQLQKEAMEMQKVLNGKVNEYAREYCEKYKLDMLIMHAQGGQFTYYNPKMDVTDSFVDYVNAEENKVNNLGKQEK